MFAVACLIFKTIPVVLEALNTLLDGDESLRFIYAQLITIKRENALYCMCTSINMEMKTLESQTRAQQLFPKGG
jgi:hypothetical protein